MSLISVTVSSSIQFELFCKMNFYFVLTSLNYLCEHPHMPSNLSIDDSLLKKALIMGEKKTKRETVNEALEEYIRRREQKKIIRHFGTVNEDGYNPKAFRRL